MPLDTLRFDDRFVDRLPGEAEARPGVRQVLGALWSPAPPTPVAAPRTLAFSRDLAVEIGLPADASGDPAFAQWFAGNRTRADRVPWATNYGGHQFGHWAGQLGDGRAMSLGEAIGPEGRRFELQLKGAGPTPYSRGADGRAVLRSSLREFLCSEAMHHLGVPTTRALCLVATGEDVVRDILYRGDPRPEPGAIVCRVAPSFIRFGHFELPAARDDRALLERLVDFTIARDFPHLEGPRARIEWFHEVCRRTALLLAHWMRVGFVHGVMNTDNLSILGLTLDYGPYGWVEDFDPDWTPNTTDAEGRRYCFGRQPQVAHWNLSRLAMALSPLFDDATPLRAGLDLYADTFGVEHGRMTAGKLGFAAWEADRDLPLAQELFRLLHLAQVDHTLFFRALAQVDADQPNLAPLEPAFYDADLRARHGPAFEAWLRDWAARVRADAGDPAARRAAMDATNPCYVARNWLAQEAIDAATAGDLAPLDRLVEVLRRPYAEQAGREHYAQRRPDWALDRPGCSMLSCSS
jgi:uncharacterized protein YdiU (UPF0061 family)